MVKTYMAMRMRMTIQAPYRVATTQAEVMFLATDYKIIFNFFSVSAIPEDPGHQRTESLAGLLSYHHKGVSTLQVHLVQDYAMT